jgi:hypothetical protein
VASAETIRADAARILLARRRVRSFARYADDPVGFAVDILGLTMWDRLADILTALRDHDRVAIRAGRKVSKSTGIVAAALWHAFARDGKVIMTSASFPQVKGILWAELQTINDRARLFTDVPRDPNTGIATINGGAIQARTAAKRENMQGYSGQSAMYLIDEASGVERDIVEAIEGNVAGGGSIVLTGNPTRMSGPFYDAFHGGRHVWTGLHISSRESPNVQQNRMVIPGLATTRFIEEAEARYGPDSPYVSVHVDGEFPASGTNNVIPLALAQAAEERWAATIPEGKLVLGVDPARSGGDETVVYPVRGLKAYPPISARNTDTYATVDLVLQAARALAVRGEKPRAHVDTIGIGAGVVDVLMHKHASVIDTIPINVAEVSTSEQHRRLRDQVWFALRAWLDEGGAYPPDDFTREDLIAATYRFDERGRYMVVSKDELRETLGRSPDRADALGLAVYRPPSTAPRVRSL